MANHTISLNATEESIYQKFLTETGQDDTTMMANMKDQLTEIVVSRVNEAGKSKFENLSVADKIAFLES